MSESQSMGPLADTSSVELANAYLANASPAGHHAQREVFRHWRGDYYLWDGAAYRRLELENLVSQLHRFLCGLRIRLKNGDDRAFSPEPRKTRAVLETLACECQAHADQMPTWLDVNRPNPADTIAFRNGILDVSRLIANPNELLIPPTPQWFSEIALPYAYDRNATCPLWRQFLNSVLTRGGRADQAAMDLLQEWVGYCLSSDTRFQKLLMLIGPPRSGKGTIIRMMQRVIGEMNCASPPFASLADRFGLEPLIGKRVATVADAHLGRDADAVQVLDRILQISGEDAVTVERKHKKALPGVRLGVRFTIAANEPPDLPDSSGALIPRLLMLQFHETFAGREDLNLEQRLATEVAGIASWALEGLRRLRQRGCFTEPPQVNELRNDYLRQTAPIQAFLQDRCEMGTTKEHWAEVDDLWQGWKEWAGKNGHHPGSKEGFGKRLRSARPSVYKRRKKRFGRQQYEYAGIRLLPIGELPFAMTDDEEESDIPELA